MSQSTPSLSEFNPTLVPYQYEVIKDIRTNFDYTNGYHELLLSGSVGSAKSILMAHIAVTHCLFNPGARICLGRKAMPDLKDTIFLKIIEHLDCEELVEKEHYTVNWTRASIQFINGSEIISRSWADKKIKKFRSLELSGLIIEELTENESREFYDEAKARVGRLPHVKENFIICATNPDAPSHWAYEYFIQKQGPHRHVYYSKTTDNPFLPDWYIKNLEETLDPKMARRMIHGEWLTITSDVVYYQYDPDIHYRPHEKYHPIPSIPIHISFDFNIGIGKPFSVCLFQFDGRQFHFFAEVVLESSRTLDACEEMAARGLLDFKCPYIINGDATGKSRDTRGSKSDYDIIWTFMSNYRTKDNRRLMCKLDVPRANPPIRERHNIVNGVLRNSKGQIGLHIYQGCETLNKGFSLTHLKKGGQYIEDDGPASPWQHITTAAGYGILAVKREMERPTSTSGDY